MGWLLVLAILALGALLLLLALWLLVRKVIGLAWQGMLLLLGLGLLVVALVAVELGLWSGMPTWDLLRQWLGGERQGSQGVPEAEPNPVSMPIR